MSRALDHVVLVVADLDREVDRYRANGFTVSLGGRHEHSGAANALVPFEDESYLELFSFVDVDKAPRSHTNWPAFERGGGLVSFWLTTGDVQADVEAFRALGVALDGPREGSRRRPDGYEVRFRLAIAPRSTAPFAPAIIQDLTPRLERVPPYEPHRNGVSSMGELVIAVPDLEPARRLYGGLGFAIEEAQDSLAIRLGSAAICFRAGESVPDWGLRSVRLVGAAGTAVELPR